MTDPVAINYLNGIEKFTPVNFSEKYPGAGNEAINLLNGMLTFNPYLRTTVDEALAHPFFAKIKKADKEKTFKGVKFEFEFDKAQELSEETLRKLIMEEVKNFKK